MDLESEINMKVYDCFTFFNELDMLEIRLRELNDVVDVFVIAEWAFTHSGVRRKEFVLEKNWGQFKKYESKMRYIKILDEPVSDTDFWKNENYQRNCLERGLYDATKDDIIMVGDVDEIPYSETIIEVCAKSSFPQALVADQYYYNMSVRTNTNKHPEVFTTVFIRGPEFRKLGSGMFKVFADLNEVRHESWNLGGGWLTVNRDPKNWINKHLVFGGWHLSFFLTPEQILNKITAYAHKEFSNPRYANMDYILDRIKNGDDLFLRPDANGWKVDWKTVRIPKLIAEQPERFKMFLPEGDTITTVRIADKEPKFSVVLIARNESKTLPKLIQSLKEFQERGGEIVLVDTGSTDGTAELARSLGCKVEEVGTQFIHMITDEEAAKMNELFLEEPEELIVKGGDKLFDFSKARNFAVTLAKNDVVAMPDCDEAYTALNIDVLNQAITDGVEQFEYNFVFSHDEFGREAIKFLHSKFYDRRKMKWVRIVHEVLDGVANRRWFPEEIIKLEHWQNPEQNRSGYLKGLAYDCYEDPKSDRNYHYFGRELMWMGRPRSAIKVLMKHLEISWWNQEKAESMLYIGDCNKALGDDSGAVEWYHKAFTEDCSRREAMLKLAEHYYQKKDPVRTVAYVEAALTLPHSNFYAVDQKSYTWFPHEMGYWAYWLLKNFEKSKEHFDKALAFEPSRPNFVWDYRQYYTLPKMSFVIPTLGLRKEGLDRCIKSIHNTMYPPDKIEVIVVEDSPRKGMPIRLKEGVEKSTGEWIVFASDDVEFTFQCIMQAYFTHKNTGKHLITFNTGPLYPDEGNICEHFMIHKDLIPRIGGEIFDTEMNHTGVDNLLWAKCKKLNEAARSELGVLIHHHFKDGKTPIDETYQVAWEKNSEDKEILKRKLEILNAT